jgi:hypothetical protein
MKDLPDWSDTSASVNPLILLLHSNDKDDW